MHPSFTGHRSSDRIFNIEFIVNDADRIFIEIHYLLIRNSAIWIIVSESLESSIGNMTTTTQINGMNTFELR